VVITLNAELPPGTELLDSLPTFVHQPEQPGGGKERARRDAGN
jgi:hypothetical protein